MEIKELVRERMFTEIIAERDNMVLDLNEQVNNLKTQLGALQEQLNKTTAS